jgi:hypothetical protein
MTIQTASKKGNVIERKWKHGSRFYARVPYRRDGRCRYHHLGTHATPEDAREAIRVFLETGVRVLNGRPSGPPGSRKPKPPYVPRVRAFRVPKEPKAKREKKRVIYIAKAQTRAGMSYYVTGRDPFVKGGGRLYVGTFESQMDAEAAGAKFIETGETRQRQFKQRGCPASRKVKLSDIRISEGRNLRDHGVSVLKRFRPELLGGDPRARRPDETVADWFKRLAVMKGFIAA